MMTIYIDNDYKCHAAPAEGLTAVETDYFDGKCAAYIEGYRYVPEGETWTREDGVQFEGEMVSPWVDYAMLDAAQRDFERAELERLRAENAQYETALTEIETALGV